MSAFKFIDELPIKERRGGRPGDPLLYEFADALRQNPGKWAVWPKSQTAGLYTATNKAQQVRSGKYPAFPIGEFEASSRKGVTYVRYVGGAE